MRVILADHHAQALLALRTMLTEHPELDLAGAATNAQDLLRLAEEQNPDLVLVDYELPGDAFDDLIARLHALIPPPIVIVMSSKFECSRMVLQAGADAFVSKGNQPDWLLEKLRQYAGQFKMKEDADQIKP